MTEVVTNAAVSLQPHLQANRLQAFGIDQADPTASDQAALIAAVRQDAALQATQVPQAGGDRSSLPDNFGSAGNGGSYPSSPDTQSGSQDPGQDPTPTTGPARAVVTLQAFDVTSDGPSSQPQQGVSPTEASALNAAAELNGPQLENIAANVIGTAFAPVQLVQVGVTAPKLTPKDVIFGQRKMFDGEVVVRRTGIGVAAAATSTFAAAAQAAQQTFAAGSSGEASGPSFEALYQRAQVVAETLGAKAPANPAVKQLFTDLARYGVAGVSRPAAPKVTLTA